MGGRNSEVTPTGQLVRNRDCTHMATGSPIRYAGHPMYGRILLVGLASALFANGSATGQSHPAPSPDSPLLHMCNASNPPPCVDKPPVIVNSPDPKYPKNTRREKGQGVVVLDLIVGTDGLAHDVHVKFSLGPGFDEEAIKAVKQWTFRPATSQGKPVPASLNVHVAFPVAR